MTRGEHETMVKELKRMLTSKDDLLKTRQQEADSSYAELERKLRTTKEDADRRVREAEDELATLRLQLRQKETQVQHEIAAAEQNTQHLQSRITALDAQVEAERGKTKSTEARLEDMREEQDRLLAKINEQHLLVQRTKAAHDRLAQDTELAAQDANKRLEAAEKQHADSKERLEGLISELQGQLRDAIASAEREAERKQEEFDAKLQALEENVTRREREVSELQIAKHELERQVWKA